MAELWCPFAIAEPTDNHGGQIDPNVVGMVHHVTEGMSEPGPWFRNPQAQASSHFGIDLDGTLYQYVDMLLCSWAQSAGNYSYWSVEVVGNATQPDTDAQIATFGRLFLWCSQVNEMAERPAFGFTLAETPGEHGLGWHGMGGDAWGGHYGCPGDLRKAQRQQILNVAQGGSAQPTVPTNTDPTRIVVGSDVEESLVKPYFIHSPLDGKGNGYVDLQGIAAKNVVSIVANDANPPQNGYIQPPLFGRLDVSPGPTTPVTRVVIHGGFPGGAIDFVVWSA